MERNSTIKADNHGTWGEKHALGALNSDTELLSLQHACDSEVFRIDLHASIVLSLGEEKRAGNINWSCEKKLDDPDPR